MKKKRRILVKRCLEIHEKLGDELKAILHEIKIGIMRFFKVKKVFLMFVNGIFNFSEMLMERENFFDEN